MIDGKICKGSQQEVEREELTANIVAFPECSLGESASK